MITEVLTDFLTEKNLQSEGLKYAYYVPKFNLRGWGVVYARFYVGDTLIRISTKVKAKKSFWNNGIILYPSSAMMSDKIIMRNVDTYLTDLYNRVDKVYCDFLCNETETESLTLINNIKNVINPMRSAKARKPQSLISMLKQTVEVTTENAKTKISQDTYINSYAEFLKVNRYVDDIKTLNQRNVLEFRNWLVDNLASSTARNTLTNFITIIHKCELKYDVNFGISRSNIPKIEDKRTTEERRENVYALTNEDLDKLRNVKLSKTKSIIRDLFLILCQTSVRIEDLPELLNPKNYQDKDGVTYAIFKAQKTDARYIIPLNDSRLYANTLELINKYVGLSVPKTVSFNIHLKEIARQANLGTLITHTSDKGGKKIEKTIHVYDKISSHWGRHTFITNAIRYFKLSPDKIKHITSHTDTTMIENVYTNTTVQDNINILSTALGETSQKTSANNTNNSASKSNNYNIDGLEEAKSVMRYLRIGFDDNVTFENAIQQISMRQIQLIEDYGINIEILKNLFNLTLPMNRRVYALHNLLESLK